MPLTGMGVLACLFAATALTAGLVIWADRRAARRQGGHSERPADAPRRPMSPLAAAGLTLGGVVLLAYILLVIRAA